MCVPGVAQAAQVAANAALSIGKTVVDYNQQSKNNEYRAQAAINNIKAAQDEAKKQTQLGIDKARDERIAGIKAASAVLAQNSSGGFDVNSDTNFLNYIDTRNSAFSNAKSIEDEYNSKAQNYYSKANNYLNNYNISKKSYKQSLVKSAINSLGNYTKVASSWYLDNIEGDNL